MQAFIKTLCSRTSILTVALGLTTVLAGGCDSESDLSVRAAEVEAAQEGAGTFHEKNDACIQAFEACLNDGGDPRSCHGQLEGCEPPDIDIDQGMCTPPPKDCDGEGDRPPPPQDGEGGDKPPPPQDGEGGDMPPPPQDGEGGDMPPPHDGEQGDRPHGSDKGPGCRPPLAHEEIRGCHDAAKACVDDGGDPQACGETLHSCIQDAVETAFEALCAENLAACEGNEDDEHCAHMAQICEEGIPMPPPPPGN